MGKNTPALANYNAGELSPDFAGRVDQDKYAVGCSALSNFIPRIQGPSRRRPGTRYVQPVKTATQRTWLRKFVFSQAQAYQVEFGSGYCRFYTNHGQVQVSGVAAWSNATAYTVGALVVQGGVNYYCILANTNQSPPNATYWYPLTGTIYEIPSPYTAGMLTNPDNTCGLQLEQSGDVLYIACGGYWPMTLTRYGATNWVLAPYAPPDGPFLDQNASNTPALYITPVTGALPYSYPYPFSPLRPFVGLNFPASYALPQASYHQYTCHATAPVFSPTDVATATTPGRLVRIDVQYFNTQPWANGVAVTVGALRRYNGSTYQALNSATTGPAAPIHTSGTAWDGAGGVQWLYQDSGYGIGQVTAYTSPTQVTLTVSPYANQQGSGTGSQFYRFPQDVQGITAAISGITATNPAVVTATAHGFSVGDPVYLTGIGGMTQLSEQMYVISAVTANTFTLAGADASGLPAYTSGGTAIKNASLRWQLGAWGQGATGYTGQFPTSLCMFADRLFWGVGISWWGSAPGQYNSHTQDLYSLVTADCAVDGIIAAQDVDAITWMSPANVLLIGTKGGEFGLGPITPTAPIGPGNTQVVRQSKMRSRAVRAEIIGTSNFYVQASGKKVMAQDYNFYLDRYESTNQNRLANHIAGYTVGSGIIDATWHAEPYECLWGVRNDGVLIGYIFDRQDNVTGWAEQPMGATMAGPAVVECVSVIPAPDGTRDELWMIVKRTIGGAVVRSIEYMEKDLETGDAQNTMCYVDMSAVYNGAPTTTISGLSWLSGETVSIARDGGGHNDKVVQGGQITLDYAGSVVQIGLKCPANLITMDIEGGADVGTAQGKVKRAVSAVFRVKNTLGGYAGMAGGILDLIQPNVSTTNLGSPPPLTTGDTPRITLPGDYDTSCKIQVQQPQPFPIEIIGIFPHITVQEPSTP